MFHTGDRVLVCISYGEQVARIVRTTANATASARFSPDFDMGSSTATITDGAIGLRKKLSNPASWQR